jgi:hypothetical protein
MEQAAADSFYADCQEEPHALCPLKKVARAGGPKNRVSIAGASHITCFFMVENYFTW